MGPICETLYHENQDCSRGQNLVMVSTCCLLSFCCCVVRMYLSVSRKVGGLALLFRCTTNSSGTLERASSPKICSLGIHPSMFIRSNQWAITSSEMSRSQVAISSSWKPSSHRKPLGKKLLEGTAVYSGAFQ